MSGHMRSAGRATGGEDTGCPRGDPGCLVLNPGSETIGKGSDRLDGQLGRKEGGKRHDWETGAKKEPLGDS